MKKTLRTLGAFCLLSLLFACNKQPEIPTESTYTFTNQTGSRVMFDIYDSQGDYSLNANRKEQYIIESGATQQIRLEVAKKLWIDWYTPDYAFHNWQSIRSSYNRSNPTPELSVAAEDDNFTLRTAIRDTARSVLLNGDGTSTNWQGSVPGPSPLAGTHRFQFRKDFTGIYTYTDENGASKPSAFEYYISGSTVGLGIQQRFTVNVLSSPTTSTLFQITCTPGTLYTPHTGRDAMLVRFVQFGSLPEVQINRQ